MCVFSRFCRLCVRVFVCAWRFRHGGIADAIHWPFTGDLLIAAHDGQDQADRAISTGQLHALLRFHIRPINVVVFHGSRGYLVLRGASRLDAFSGYPFRT